MLNYMKLASDLDKIAERVEASGLTEEALALDKVADALEAMTNYPPQAIQLARELGITLNPQTVAEIITKYSNPPMGATGDLSKEALAVNPKLRQFVALAALLASSFLSSVEAKGNPVTVNTPFGQKTYSVQDLKQLKKADPKSFAIVMEQYNQQEKQNLHSRTQDSITTDESRSAPKPGVSDKVVKNVEDMSDDFGNEARLITYNDGTKYLEGDILQNGVSLRDKLTRSGEIPHDPSGQRAVSEEDRLSQNK